jgi:hypothetical protein
MRLVLSLRVEHRLLMLNVVGLSRIFEHKREEETLGWRKLHNE